MQNLEQLKLLATTIRMLSADGVQKANSGHPGMPMGAADYSALLWANYLRFNPKDTSWLGRDRFVLSAGHGSMLLYSLLHLFGYDLPMSELQSFRQWGSKTPGHPEFGLTAGVETTTGPLGQGFGNGVGMALSAKLLQARYSEELFASRVFGVVSDGDLMEGVASEAASIAGHLGLNNLIYIYDDNHISIGGDTKVCFTESVPKRFEAYGWFVQSVDGHDMEATGKAIDAALREQKRPSIICARTVIGKGAPKKAGTSHVHGEPLGEEELKATKEAFGWPLEPRFHIPKEVGAFCCSLMEGKVKEHAAWQSKFATWQKSNPEKAAQLQSQISRTVPAALKDELIRGCAETKKEATRNISGKALQVLAKHLPALIGGSADLEPSTKTLIKDSTDVQPGQFGGKNLRFGVREHGMGAVVNGLAYQQCWIPYSATFLVFSDYMRPTLRLAALCHLQSLFIFTHESIYLGEDGPTHQPIEHTASLRLIPNLHVHRPADSMEVAMCYYGAVQHTHGPSVLLFTRQGLPPLERRSTFQPDDVLKGGYVVQEYGKPVYGIVATGSEVGLAVAAAQELAKSGSGARVISMPCVERFVQQPETYRKDVLGSGLKLVSIEAGHTTGWERIVGANGLRIGIDHFGASAPAEVLAEKFGFTPAAVVKRIQAWA